MKIYAWCIIFCSSFYSLTNTYACGGATFGLFASAVMPPVTPFDADALLQTEAVFDFAEAYHDEYYYYEQDEEPPKRVPVAQRSKVANLHAWQQYFNEVFGQKISKEALEALIYKTNASDIEVLEIGGDAPQSLQKNAVVKALARGGAKADDFWNYIYLAKQAEPWANGGKNTKWAPSTPDKLEDTERLIQQAQGYYRRTENKRLKMRLAYQMVRLARYRGDAERAINYYRLYAKPLEGKVKTPIQYWALEQVAGAYSDMNDDAMAARLFAEVFLHAPSRRRIVYLSYQLSNRQEWNKALTLCENNAQKAAVHALRAFQNGANLQEEMKMVYGFAPESEVLPLLLVREIDEIDRIIAHNRLIDNDNVKKGLTTRLTQLKAFTSLVIRENKAYQVALWKLIDAYIVFRLGDFNAAQIRLEKLNAQKVLPAHLADIAEGLEAMIEVQGYTYIDASIEKRLDALRVGKLKKAQGFILQRVAQLYRKQNETAKAFLCEYEMLALLCNPRPELVDGLLTLATKRNPNDFEQYLLSRLTRYRLKERTPTNLYEIKGTLLLGEGKVKEAIEYFERLPRIYHTGYEVAQASWKGYAEQFDVYVPGPSPYDRFVLSAYDGTNPLQDIHPQCRKYIVQKDKQYCTKLDVARTLLALEKAAKNSKSRSEKARIYETIGLLWQSIDSYGKYWRTTDYFIVSYRNEFMAPQNTPHRYGGPMAFGDQIYDYSARAHRYFMKAADLLPAEQAARMLTRVVRGETPQALFHEIQQRYQNTVAYEQFRQNCGAFKQFTN